MGRTDSTEIDGIRLITTSIPVMRALVMWTRFAKILAPTLTHIRSLDASQVGAVKRALDAASSDEGIAGLDPTTVVALLRSIGPAATEFLERIEPSIEEIARELLVNTIAVVDGGKMELSRQSAIDAAFDDRVGTLVQALWWVARFNFENFRRGSRAKSDAGPKTASR